MDNLLHHAANVAIALGVVDDTQTTRTFPVLGVRLEDGAAALTLSTDNATLREEQARGSEKQNVSGCWGARFFGSRLAAEVRQALPVATARLTQARCGDGRRGAKARSKLTMATEWVR